VAVIRKTWPYPTSDDFLRVSARPSASLRLLRFLKASQRNAAYSRVLSGSHVARVQDKWLPLNPLTPFTSGI